MKITSEPRADGQLSLVEVDEGPPASCVTSVGEQLWIKSEKLLGLAWSVCRESSALTLRIWHGRDGVELAWLRRAGERRTAPSTEPTWNPSTDVF